MSKKIKEFIGKYRFLSNFFMAEVKLGNAVYPSTEHAYQAAKTKNKKLRRKVAKAKTANDAKRIGRQLTLREDWENIKVGVMYRVCYAKFTQHADLKEKLLATGDAKLIEGNWWGDTFWGVCDGKGKNKLGQVLMMIREELRDSLSD